MADRTEQRATCPTCGGERFFPKILPHPTEDAYCFDKWHESSPGAAGATPQVGDSSDVMTQEQAEMWLENHEPTWQEVVELCRWAYSRAGVAATVETPQDCLLNLLAVIHRDGGHYAAEHGIAKASKDAEAIVVKLLAASEPTEEEQRATCPTCHSNDPDIRICLDKPLPLEQRVGDEPQTHAIGDEACLHRCKHNFHGEASPDAAEGAGAPINWQLFKAERDRLPEYERENFTADVIDQLDDEQFRRVLERNRAIYAEQYPIPPAAAGPTPQKWDKVASELIDGLKLRGIQYNNDLCCKGTPWESVAEPQPQYFATFLEAYDFQIKLAGVAAEQEEILLDKLREIKVLAESHTGYEAALKGIAIATTIALRAGEAQEGK